MHVTAVLRRLGRDPLTHFLLIGLLLFGLYGAAGGGGDRSVIRVDDKVLRSLHAEFRNTWQREPSAEELNALVGAYVRDEIFYREGVAIGLDREDPTIKRRVSQKFATIAEESKSAAAASDEDLDRWLKQHPGRYASPSLVTFDQIAFEAASYDAGAAAVRSARAALVAGVDPKTLGSGRMLLPRFELYPIDLVQREFGPDFAKALLAARRGSWEGPVRSGYGLHLVRVDRVVDGRIPELNEVRASVARDYEADRRAKALDGAYATLSKKYKVQYPSSWKRAS
jgi:hypothetical protein